MRFSRLSASLVIVAFLVAGCSASPELEVEQQEVPPSPEAAAAEPEPAVDVVGDACALLDDIYLDTTLADVESTFGGSLDFQPHGQTEPNDFCRWRDVTGAMSISVSLEDATITDIDDHSGRAYNIDVDPVVEPQEGPGESAVVLVDTAFADLREDEGFAYGYFFVQDGLAVFVRTTGLEIGRENLRVLADEVSARLGAS